MIGSSQAASSPLALPHSAASRCSQSAVAQDVTDGPGPNLVIEVAGSTTGTIVIDMASDVAPNHVAQITALAQEGAYDGVVFHRVIDGFMAQTGDVEFGKTGGDLSGAGMGGSSKPDLAAEFSSMSFDRGVVGMARSMDPNCANSQFFIMFARRPASGRAIYRRGPRDFRAWRWSTPSRRVIRPPMARWMRPITWPSVTVAE